jgi:hypothetical protein
VALAREQRENTIRTRSLGSRQAAPTPHVSHPEPSELEILFMKHQREAQRSTRCLASTLTTSSIAPPESFHHLPAAI